jgi:putative transposase
MWSVEMLCNVMQVTARGFRKWLTRPMSSRQRGDMKVLAHIREQYGLSLGSYGRPRMTMELKEAGLDVGERRVGRLMKLNGIKPVRTRKHKVTTNSNHSLGIAANVLDGDFTAEAPNRKWAKQAKVPAIRSIVGKRSGGRRHQLYLDSPRLALPCRDP